jgi:hypothetical protein
MRTEFLTISISISIIIGYVRFLFKPTGDEQVDVWSEGGIGCKGYDGEHFSQWHVVGVQMNPECDFFSWLCCRDVAV